MKRIFSFIAACAMILATAGCQEELVQPEVQQPVEGLEYVDITFDVTAPSGPQTKTTYGETVTFPTELIVQVYVGEDNVFGEKGQWLEDVKKVITPKGNSNTEWEVTLTLVKNYIYDIVFWAQRKTAAPYSFDWEHGKITANYKVAANDITRDAFYHLCKGYNSFDPKGASIGLKRPFAQINLGASDYSALEELYNFVGTESDLKSTIVTSSVPSVLNVLTGTADTPAAVKFLPANTTDKSYNLVADENDIKVTGKDAEGKEVTKSYTLVGTNYILANVNKPDNPTMDITMTFAYNGKSFDIEVPNVPYARNYQTNILGNYFTDESKFEVYIVPGFGGDHYYNMDLTLEEAFKVDRDVTYVLKEDQVITDALELSNGKEVTIDLNGFDITAPDGVDAFYVTNGTLTITNSNEKAVGTVKTQDKTAGYAVFVDGENAKAIIEGGNFVVGVDDLASYPEIKASNSAVYTKNGATAEIKGGTFSVETEQTFNDVVNKTRYLINENDSNRGTITITGGTYVEFDPSNNLAEDAGTDFLADGYVAVPSEVEGKTVYTVKKNAVLAAVAAGSDAVTIEGTEEFVKPVMIESGKTFTLTLGEEAVLTSHNADPDTHASVFEVHGELVINGDGKVDAGEGAASNIAVWARGEGAKITINGGYFTNGADAAANASPVIYASKKDAQIIINGGTFEAGAQSPSDFSKPTYPVLNLYDPAAADGAMITVYGGTFINFDPSNPGTEVAAWNAAHPNGFVADGYTVESEEKDGKMYYTVVKKPAVVITPIKDVEAGKEYTVEGTVVAVGVKAYFVSDGTGNLLVYGTNHGRTLMDKVRLTGTASRYDNKETNSIQLSVTNAELISTGNTWTYNPTVLDGSSLSGMIGQTSTAEEVQFTGLMSVGEYANITVDGASKSASLYYVNASEYSDFNGKKVIVKGYVTGQGSYFNVLPYSVELMPADWALRGIGGDWNTDYPMYEDGDWYVASDLEITEFKFKKVGEENWQGKGSVNANYPTKLGGDGNIKVNNASGKYDIYLHKTLKFFAVTTAGKAPVVNWGIIGNWDGTPNWEEQMMTLKSGQYVLENVDIPANFVFKVRANGTWDNGIQYGSSGAAIAESGTDYALAWDSSDISSSLEAGTYSIYVASDLSTIRFVKAADSGSVVATCLDFTGWNFGGAASWTSTYEEHVVAFDVATVTFESANKQNGTITDCPVTKGRSIVLIMKDNKTISSIVFNLAQWATKAQTAKLYVSKDNGNSYSDNPVAESSNFKLESGILESGINAVKVTFSSSSNQVALKTIDLSYNN